MTKPRKITVEILTSDPTNQDAIAGLLEVCRWLQCNWGTNTSTSNQSTLFMDAKALARVEVQQCDKCSKFKPVDATFCFGCIQAQANLMIAVKELNEL